MKKRKIERIIHSQIAIMRYYYDLKFNKETLSRTKRTNKTFKTIRFSAIVPIISIVSIVFLILYYVALSHLDKFFL